MKKSHLSTIGYRLISGKLENFLIEGLFLFEHYFIRCHSTFISPWQSTHFIPLKSVSLPLFPNQILIAFIEINGEDMMQMGKKPEHRREKIFL